MNPRLALRVEVVGRPCIGHEERPTLTSSKERALAEQAARTADPHLPQKATMKTPMSRFQIHDDPPAPEGAVPVLRGALATGGQLPNFLGALAGSPAALRGYARFRSELRRGALAVAPLERISLAVAGHH